MNYSYKCSKCGLLKESQVEKRAYNVSHGISSNEIGKGVEEGLKAAHDVKGVIWQVLGATSVAASVFTANIFMIILTFMAFGIVFKVIEQLTTPAFNYTHHCKKCLSSVSHNLPSLESPVSEVSATVEQAKLKIEKKVVKKTCAYCYGDFEKSHISKYLDKYVCSSCKLSLKDCFVCHKKDVKSNLNEYKNGFTCRGCDKFKSICVNCGNMALSNTVYWTIRGEVCQNCSM